MKDWKKVLIAILFVGVVFDVVGDAQAMDTTCILGPTVSEGKTLVCAPVDRPRFWGRR